MGCQQMKPSNDFQTSRSSAVRKKIVSYGFAVVGTEKLIKKNET